MNTSTRPLANALAAATLLALVGLVAGCAVPTTLPKDAVAKVERTDVRSHVPQSEVNVQFMPSSYGAGLGLVGAIVDVSVNSALASSAKARATKLRETVRDFDVRLAYWNSISNTIMETRWLKPERIEWRATNVTRLKAPDVESRSVLNLGANYRISPDTRVFEMVTGLDIFLPGKPKKPAASLFLTSHSSRIGDEEGDKALALWMADQGAAYRRAATEAVVEQRRLLRFGLDFLGGETSAMQRPAKIKARLIHGRAEFGIPVGRQGLRGTIVDETDTRVIFRNKLGHLISFPKQEIEIVSEK